uniref:Transmembrane protein 244 n=1 Tax=Falco tinnunculus TaxID=100819 RepID=A0A8C4UV56_FALTI
MLTYKNVFLGENQLLLPADVGVRNIATALPFNIMCPWLSRSKLLKVRIKMLDGLAPFDFKTNPSWINPYYLVLVISLEITFFICGLLFALIVEEWVWDYAVTVTIIHIIITSVVMSEFPLTLHWWLALGSGVISMISGGQTLAYCLFKDNFIYPILDDF